MTYAPSADGRGHLVMTGYRSLEPGATYRIARIERGVYLVLEGFEDTPGGGIYWTEFANVHV